MEKIFDIKLNYGRQLQNAKLYIGVLTNCVLMKFITDDKKFTYTIYPNKRSINDILCKDTFSGEELKIIDGGKLNRDEVLLSCRYITDLTKPYFGSGVFIFFMSNLDYKQLLKYIEKLKN
jgi:hypothetical protein